MHKFAPPAETAGSFEQRLRAGAFAITAEVTPPLSASKEALLAKCLPLRGLADAVNVTDGAGAHAHMSATVAAAIMMENGVEPILQFTCRDRNRIALQSELLGAAALGIRNLLMLRGDDPARGDQPEAKPVFDLDSLGLLQLAVRMRDEHEIFPGRAFTGDASFFIGAADAPRDPVPGWSPDGLKAKADAGAQFVQTQFCMDAELVRRYVDRLAEHGLINRLHLLIGVVPLRSVRSARWIRDNLFGSVIPDAVIERMEQAADPAEEGQRICLEMLQQLAEIPGVSGAHVMAPGHDDIVPRLIEQARRIGLRKATLAQ